MGSFASLGKIVDCGYEIQKKLTFFEKGRKRGVEQIVELRPLFFAGKTGGYRQARFSFIFVFPFYFLSLPCKKNV